MVNELDLATARNDRFPVRARQHDVQRRAPAQRAPMRRGFARQKPGGAFVNPKDSTYPWSSAEVTSGGDLMLPREVRSGALPRTTEETRVVRSIRLPPRLPFSSRRTAHRTIWPTKTPR